MNEHNILELLDYGLVVMVNSDDPAYFGGYINENFMALYKALSLNIEQASKLAENSFKASFLPSQDIESQLYNLRKFIKSNRC